MKNFFKENFALAVGIALPLLLIVLFFAAGKISQTTVPGPQYDAVFATNYYAGAHNNPYDISVKKGSIVIEFNELEKGTVPNNRPAQLYIFDHQTLTVKLMDIDFDNVKNGEVKSESLDELNQSRINAGPVSRDGYKFENTYRSSGGFFSELFTGYHHRHRFALRKRARTIPVTSPDSYYYNTHFVGWVEP